MTLDTTRLGDLETAHLRMRTLQLSVEGYLADAKSESTRRAYRSDLAQFEDWCRRTARPAMPASPETVALYLADLAGAGAKASTIQRRLASISVAHQMAGQETPTRSSLVRTTMQGIRRRHGIAPRQATALRLATLRRLLEATPEESAGAVRDHAVLLLGFAGGLRRSEIAALDVGDLRREDEGLMVTVRRSKSDQEGAGRQVALPRGRHALTCPVTAVLRWVTVAGLDDGPLFRRIDRWDHILPERMSGRTVAEVLRRAAVRAGLDPAEYAGHSLRSGFATEAAAQGAAERAIMEQTGHRSVQMVRRYIRSGGRWKENAAAVLGL
jgi:site-specific recombinase XerD